MLRLTAGKRTCSSYLSGVSAAQTHECQGLNPSIRLYNIRQMMTKLTRFCLCVFILVLCLFMALCHSLDSLAVPEATSIILPEISLNQTANLKLVFLGAPSEYINQSQLLSLLPQNVKQFAYPNTIIWTLNFSFVLYPFPENVSDSLRTSAFYSEGSAYFTLNTQKGHLRPEKHSKAVGAEVIHPYSGSRSNHS